MTIRLGVVGYGYWGPNLVRNFTKCSDCRLEAIADLDPKKRRKASQHYPDVTVTADVTELFDDDKLDAIVVATPIQTHYDLARKALESGKHVLVEKPLTGSVAHARDLLRLAEKNERVLMVDHTFIHTGAISKLHDLISSGELGDLLYYDSVRVNLGLFQPDLNVLWDLAPHDFSIMSHLIGRKPRSVSAIGSAPVRCEAWGLESVAYVNVEFEDHFLAHFHVNWLSPVKIRRTLIGGSKKMVIYDHLDPDNQIKIFDKGVDIRSDRDRYSALISYRTGDLLAPKIDQTEALENVCNDFLGAIRRGGSPLTDGQSGLSVVRMLEAAQMSMSTPGNPKIRLTEDGPDLEMGPEVHREASPLTV